jgi:hypothetical protein
MLWMGYAHGVNRDRVTHRLSSSIGQIRVVESTCHFIPLRESVIVLADGRPGTRILLSRRHPIRDVILSDGTGVKAGVDGEQVTGIVYSMTKMVLRVQLDETVKDIQNDLWR